MRGRKPTPTVSKVLAGNPGKRPLNQHEPQPRADLADAPSWLTERQKSTWTEVVEMSPPGLLKDVDASVFAVWVVAFDLYQEMKAATEMGYTPASRSRVIVKLQAAKDNGPWAAIAGG